METDAAIILAEELDISGDGFIAIDELVDILTILEPTKYENHDQVRAMVSAVETDAGGRVNIKSFLGIGNKLKIAIFSAVPYVKRMMAPVLVEFPGSFFVETPCNVDTAPLANGADAVCLFVNDDCNEEVVSVLQRCGIKLILLRCAGFDRLDLPAAEHAGITVLNVPGYSPYAIAEHAVSLALCLNRRLNRAWNRTRDGNFMLGGLVGMDLNGKTCGVAGTGKIGQIAARGFQALGMKILCYDPHPNEAMRNMGAKYVSLDELYEEAHIITLHMPLNLQTHHMIDAAAIAKMKPGVILVNVSRGGLVDTDALIKGLTLGQLGAAGLDVYEYEDSLFFRDHTKMDDETRMHNFDPTFQLLKSLPNVLITPHSAFLTEETLHNICSTTILNAREFCESNVLTNAVTHKTPKVNVLQTMDHGSPPILPSLDEVLARRRRNSFNDIWGAAHSVGEPITSMKLVIFSATPVWQSALKPLVEKFPNTSFIDSACTVSTATLCADAQAVCLFVNDQAGRDVLSIFKKHGVKLILMRCAGFDRVDLESAGEFGIKVVRVPAYSPFAVAEHAVSLALTLNRRLCRAYNRVREGVYDLSGLVGVDLNGKTVGVIGTGRIGQIAAKIFKGLGMKVLCYDVYQNDVIKVDLGLEYVDLDRVYAESDFLTLHVPLLESTRHMINDASIAKMKPGVILVNCSRGGLVDTDALIKGLQSSRIGGAGLDVYENEDGLFFKDFTKVDDLDRLQHLDTKLILLKSFSQVILTPHSAFLTHEALGAICRTTITNAEEFLQGKLSLTNEVMAPNNG